MSRRLKILGLLFFPRCVSTYYACLRTVFSIGEKGDREGEREKPPENESERKKGVSQQHGWHFDHEGGCALSSGLEALSATF